MPYNYLTRSVNPYLSVCRKLVVYIERSTGEQRRGRRARWIFPCRLINATPYFPFRLHKPPGETIETAIERDRRDFSLRANSLCILSRRMNTRDLSSPLHNDSVALSIIEPHPRCANAEIYGRERIQRDASRRARSLEQRFIKLSATLAIRRLFSAELITSVICTSGLRDRVERSSGSAHGSVSLFFFSFSMSACLL